MFSERAIGRDEGGAPIVRDVGLAVAEWERSGRQLRGTAGRPPRVVSAPALTEARPVPVEDDDDEELERELEAAAAAASAGEGPRPVALVDAQTTAMLERARKLRLENDEREGKLLDVSRAAREAFEFARVVRESVLNLPSRLSAQLAAEADQARVYTMLDQALHEALEATAAMLEEAVE